MNETIEDLANLTCSFRQSQEGQTMPERPLNKFTTWNKCINGPYLAGPKVSNFMCVSKECNTDCSFKSPNRM